VGFGVYSLPWTLNGLIFVDVHLIDNPHKEIVIGVNNIGSRGESGRYLIQLIHKGL